MQVANSVALVTGANRGIGLALVERLVAAGANKVYAAARDPGKLDGLVKRSGGKVTALKLDVTDRDSIAVAARTAKDVTLLINNAGALEPGSVLAIDDGAFRRQFETNFFGLLNVTRAFVPVLEAHAKAGGSAAIANVLSVVSLANIPMVGAYSTSKAAAHSATLGLRLELAPKGIEVYGVHPGPVDTDMAKGLEFDKATPEDVAVAIIKGIESRQAYIFPDAMAREFYNSWSTKHAEAEKQIGAM